MATTVDARAALGAAALALCVGCSDGDDVNAAAVAVERERSIDVVDTQEVALQSGRLFTLQTLEAELDGDSVRTLQVLGDGVAISLHASGGPHTASVSGDSIRWGPHALTPQPLPGSWILDGELFQLDPPGFYAFSEGEFIGRIR